MILPGETIPNLTVISETKVNFGKEKSHVYYREIIKSVLCCDSEKVECDLHLVSFYVVNDGSPIDFYISHGSLAGAGKGTARIVMAGVGADSHIRAIHFLNGIYRNHTRTTTLLMMITIPSGFIKHLWAVRLSPSI